MLRFLLIFIVIISPPVLFAQPGNDLRCQPRDPDQSDNLKIKQAGDFTITTTDGITRNLYNTLDSGKTVFIDLFYTTCSYCQLYAPVIEEIYQNTGAGQGDIEFWGISNNLFDTNNVIDQYKLDYNITNPCAGPWGGGSVAFTIIVDGQNFQGFPTYCVICPDRTLIFDVCYPPYDTCFDPYFEQCAANGINDHPAGNTLSSILSVYPNPASNGLYAEISSNLEGSFSIEMFNMLGLEVYHSTYEKNSGKQLIFIPAYNLPEGEYFIRISQNGLYLDTKKAWISR